MSDIFKNRVKSKPLLHFFNIGDNNKSSVLGSRHAFTKRRFTVSHPLIMILLIRKTFVPKYYFTRLNGLNFTVGIISFHHVGRSTTPFQVLLRPCVYLTDKLGESL